MQTYTPIRGMILCHGHTGDYVLRKDYDQLSAKLDTILTDSTYQGGVQDWIAKHDRLLANNQRLMVLLLSTIAVLENEAPMLSHVEKLIEELKVIASPNTEVSQRGQ